MDFEIEDLRLPEGLKPPERAGKKEVEEGQIWTRGGLRLDGLFLRIVKLAAEYEIRTGRSAKTLTIGQLLFRLKILEQREKADTQLQAMAVAVAMSGKPEAWEALE